MLRINFLNVDYVFVKINCVNNFQVIRARSIPTHRCGRLFSAFGWPTVFGLLFRSRLSYISGQSSHFCRILLHCLLPANRTSIFHYFVILNFRISINNRFGNEILLELKVVVLLLVNGGRLICNVLRKKFSHKFQQKFVYFSFLFNFMSSFERLISITSENFIPRIWIELNK